MRAGVSFAGAGAAGRGGAAVAAYDDPSPAVVDRGGPTSRFALPTLSSSRGGGKASCDTTVPPDVAELSRLTPRERIVRESRGAPRGIAADAAAAAAAAAAKTSSRGSSTSARRSTAAAAAAAHDGDGAVVPVKPTSLFGANFAAEAERRRRVETEQAGFRGERMQRRLLHESQRQSMRLSRSHLALSMSLAVEQGCEERARDRRLERASPWVNNNAGANRHLYQINWCDRTGAPLPTIPRRWSGPGPGAYGASTSFVKRAA
jgi:hypothetical protein